MTTVTLRGVPITFPFEPYDIQKEYMEKVLECLQNQTNGVLESPTGTGKTLSLLCSTLAWLQLKKDQLRVQRQMVGNLNENEFTAEFWKAKDLTEKQMNSRSMSGLPTIIYASRTHSQLSQAMQELKRTAYSNMKACVLGSRDQLCTLPELAKETGTYKNQMCQLKVLTRSCHLYNRVEKKKDDPDITGVNIMDIEDIVKLGNLHKFCPFYMAKELKQQADIVFMPYNYLLDPVIRKVMAIQLSDAVVILDEAHNVEKICEESASLQIKSSDVTLAIEEVTAIMKMMANESLSFDDSPKDFDPDQLCNLKQFFLDLEKEIDKIELKSGPEGTTLEGTYIFELFGKAGVTAENFYSVTGLIANIVQFLSTVSEGPFARKGNNLRMFEDIIKVIFLGTSDEFRQKVNKCYKLHVTEEEVKKRRSDWLSKATAKSGGKVLNYWCFSPGFGMNMLMASGMRSLILTSGTLAPLKPLISELEVNVGVRLENPHIVTDDQVCVKIVTAGPDSEPLNCSYYNRENIKYISSLGRSILNLTRVIPNGLLIFFPSYPIMLKCQQHWQECGLWSDINAQKAIYVEPRDKDSFNSAMTNYYEKVNDPNLKGAIFMGVCRGKVSEGLDFADANGRAVIITGLPYPPLKDPRVILKKRYLDVCNATDREFLRGDEWYSLEASRAVNQAIGRVIRHKDDYGAILLLDARFNNAKIKGQMSLWLRNRIKHVPNFGELMRDLRMFFKKADADFGSLQRRPSSAAPSAEFEVPKTYKGDKFNFSTSSIASSSSESLSNNGEVTIHKRLQPSHQHASKRMKINLIPNVATHSNVNNTTTKEYIIMVKKSLDESSFKNFTLALKVYKDTGNVTTLTESLETIFRSKSHLKYLIPGLESYVKVQHKAEFSDYCKQNGLLD
ncbi:regulator of telomere elongation helicase 1 homolog [Leptinotarsa decemlineata]|uniref:regulator of telomere elongation helicase 1 homolog n=1 Tax=Leptinotarsa decemlineata TaxID=7539 RepID=UPI003D30C6DC